MCVCLLVAIFVFHRTIRWFSQHFFSVTSQSDSFSSSILFSRPLSFSLFLIFPHRLCLSSSYSSRTSASWLIGTALETAIPWTSFEWPFGYRDVCLALTSAHVSTQTTNIPKYHKRSRKKTYSYSYVMELPEKTPWLPWWIRRFCSFYAKIAIITQLLYNISMERVLLPALMRQFLVVRLLQFSSTNLYIVHLNVYTRKILVSTIIYWEFSVGKFHGKNSRNLAKITYFRRIEQIMNFGWKKNRENSHLTITINT